MLVLGKITTDKLEKMNAYQLAIISKILLESERIIEDKPTQIIGFSDRVSQQEKLMAEIAEFNDKWGHVVPVPPELLPHDQSDVVEGKIVDAESPDAGAKYPGKSDD